MYHLLTGGTEEEVGGEFNDGLLYPSAALVNNPHPCNLFSM